MERFVGIALPIMVGAATARYAIWFECAPELAAGFVAATGAIVVIANAVAIGGCDPSAGLVLSVGVLAGLVADATQHRGGMAAKGPVTTLAALALLAPHVTAHRGPLLVAALGVAILAAGALRDAWPARASPRSSGR